jgi:hypothetical protein
VHDRYMSRARINGYSHRAHGVWGVVTRATSQALSDCPHFLPDAYREIRLRLRE